MFLMLWEMILLFVFKRSTFKGCSISMSRQAASKNKYENGVQELFQGTDIDDIFDDLLELVSILNF